MKLSPFRIVCFVALLAGSPAIGAEVFTNRLAREKSPYLVVLDKPAWDKMAARTLRAFGPQLARAPRSMPQMLVALDWRRAKPKQIVIAGQSGAPGTARAARNAWLAPPSWQMKFSQT